MLGLFGHSLGLCSRIYCWCLLSKRMWTPASGVKDICGTFCPSQHFLALECTYVQVVWNWWGQNRSLRAALQVEKVLHHMSDNQDKTLYSRWQSRSQNFVAALCFCLKVQILSFDYLTCLCCDFIGCYRSVKRKQRAGMGVKECQRLV